MTTCVLAMAAPARLTARPSLEEQRKIIAKLEEDHGTLNVGEIWYVIEMDWWTIFKEGEESALAEEIDNSSLYDETLKGLKKDTQEEVQYVVKPSEVWEKLSQWYEASHEIKGEVVEDSKGNTVYDLFPARFLLIEQVPQEDEEEEAKVEEVEEQDKEGQIFSVSRYTKFGKLKSRLARHLGKKPQELLIWVRPTGNDSAEFEPLNKADSDKMKESILSVLPEVGRIMWELKYEVQEVDDRRLSVMYKFSREDPKVGQRIDARKGENWYEAVIEEVFPPKFRKAQTEPATESSEEGEPKKKGKKKKSDEKESQSGEAKIKVHFMSFESKEDKVFPVSSEDIQPAYSKVPDWRTQCRVKERIEVSKRVFSSSNDWIEGEILKIDRNGTSDLRTMYAKQVASRKPDDGEKVGYMKKGFQKIRKFVSPSSNKNNSLDAKRSRASSYDSQSIPVSAHGLILVRVFVATVGIWVKAHKDYVVDLGSEDIAAEGTHIQKKARHTFTWYRNEESKPAIHGVVGLRNIGNTCYMNSTLQCLFATLPVSEYFLSGEYKKDLNRKNPIGFGGKVAIAYGKLVEQYFSDSYSVVGPTDFKAVMGNAFPSFQGFAQQDTHEFFGFLIDALHEDLNKVKNKPVVDSIESDGRPDGVLAKLEWSNFLLRNKSIFVDHMYGQLKSHLVCPQCKHEATKFDPFNSWVVPIPFRDVKFVKILFVSLHPRVVRIEKKDKESPEKHTLVEKVTHIDDEVVETRMFRFVLEAKRSILLGRDVVRAMSEKMNVSADDMAIYELRWNKQSKILYEPSESRNLYTEVTNDSEYVVYELDPVESNELPVAETKESDETEEKKEKSDEQKVGLNEKLSTDKLKGGDEATEKPSGKPKIPEAKVVKPENSTENPTAEVVDSDKDAVSEEEEDDETDDVVFLSVQYKGRETYAIRAIRVADMLRIEESKTTIAGLHRIIWKRTKFLFDVDKKLKDIGYCSADHDVTDEEMELSKKLYTVSYLRKELDPDDTNLFKMSDHHHLRGVVEVKMSREGLNLLAKGVKTEAPSTYGYGRGTALEIADRALNVGFIYHDQSIKLLEPQKEDIDLYKCLEAFRLKEKLGKGDEWYCSKCKEFVQATKKMDVFLTGDVLVIALKRFRGERLRREKLGFFVDFPIEGLDLTNFIESSEQENKIFDLYAVSYHMGSMLAGHYTAKVKVGGEWFDMNDARISRTSEDYIVNQNAYVLFYRRRDGTEEAEDEAKAKILSV